MATPLHTSTHTPTVEPADWSLESSDLPLLCVLFYPHRRSFEIQANYSPPSLPPSLSALPSRHQPPNVCDGPLSPPSHFSFHPESNLAPPIGLISFKTLSFHPPITSSFSDTIWVHLSTSPHPLQSVHHRFMSLFSIFHPSTRPSPPIITRLEV